MTSDIFDVSQYKTLMLETCGFSFIETREKALVAAVRRRMAICGVTDPAGYYDLIARDQAELQQLIMLLTVKETYFFREPSFLKLVIDILIPERLAEKPARPMRILSAGCATGEEPYTIAMMLHRRFGRKSSELFAIAGVDIDPSAIEVAKEGVYGRNSFRGVDATIIPNYFVPHAQGRWKINDELKSFVTFEVVNLLSGIYPAPMLGIDIIFYRNVSIYFPSNVQRIIFCRLADLLLEGGTLIVGASETLPHDIGVLTQEVRDGLFFYRKLPVFSVEDRRSARRHPGTKEEGKPVSTPSLIESEHTPRRPRPTAPEKESRRAARSPKAAHIAGSDSEVKALFDEALTLAAAARLSEALAVLEALIANDQNFLKAHVLIGSILLHLSHFDEARVACEKALSLDSLCLEAYLMLGIIGRHEGNDEEGSKRFREAIYLNSSCWLAHVHMAEIAFAREDWLRARSGYNAAKKVLESGTLEEHGREYPPLVIKAEPFLVICRHKLSLLQEKG